MSSLQTRKQYKADNTSVGIANVLAGMSELKLKSPSIDRNYF